MSSEVRAGKAYIEFFVKDGEMQKQLKGISSKMKAFAKDIEKVGSSMVKVGGLITAPLIAAEYAFISMGSEMRGLAKRADMSVESMSQLKFAIEATGGSAENIDMAFKGMANFLQSAADGSEKATEQLKRLGLNLNTLKGLSPDKRFIAIADALSRVSDDTEQASLSNDIFGRSAIQLLGTIRAGGDTLNKFMTTARELGIVMSTEDAQAAKELSLKMKELNAQWKMIIFSVGAQLQPVFLDIAKSMQSFIPIIRDWVTENGELIRSALSMGLKIVALGGAMVGLSKVISGASGVINSLHLFQKAFQAVLLFLEVNPWVALATVIAAVGYGIYYIATASDRAAESLSKLKQSVDKIGDSYGKTSPEIKKVIDQQKRLNELRGKPLLTKVEIEESKRIAGDLSSQFGDFGFQVDDKKNTIGFDSERLKAEAKLQQLRDAFDQASRARDDLFSKFKGIHTKEEFKVIDDEVSKVADTMRSLDKEIKAVTTSLDEMNAKAFEGIEDKAREERKRIAKEKADNEKYNQDRQDEAAYNEFQTKLFEDANRQMNDVNKFIKKNDEAKNTVREYADEYDRLVTLQKESASRVLTGREMSEAQRLLDEMSQFGSFGQVNQETGKLELDTAGLKDAMELSDLQEKLEELKDAMRETAAKIAGLDKGLPDAGIAEKSLVDKLAGLEDQARQVTQDVEAKKQELDTDVGAALDEAIKKAQENSFKMETSAAGTFNAAAVQSLQGGNIQIRTMTAAEATAKSTEKLVEQGKNKTEPVFIS